ncbi:MAG: YqeG family HAD IIIA-type phosphatase [Clostridia bacterium]
MFKRFFPTFVFDKVEDIPYEVLIKERITAVIFDMDNTLVNHKYVYNKEVKKWLKELKNKNIKVCILSNSPNINKVKKIGKQLSMKYLYNGLKPWSFGFKKAQELLNEDKENIAIIGDQLFTDIYGGNRFGIKTILVNPIEKKEFWGTRIKRPLERYVIKKYNENKGINK